MSEISNMYTDATAVFPKYLERGQQRCVWCQYTLPVALSQLGLAYKCAYSSASSLAMISILRKWSGGSVGSSTSSRGGKYLLVCGDLQVKSVRFAWFATRGDGGTCVSLRHGCSHTSGMASWPPCLWLLAVAHLHVLTAHQGLQSCCKRKRKREAGRWSVPASATPRHRAACLLSVPQVVHIGIDVLERHQLE